MGGTCVAAPTGLKINRLMYSSTVFEFAPTVAVPTVCTNPTRMPV